MSITSLFSMSDKAARLATFGAAFFDGAFFCFLDDGEAALSSSPAALFFDLDAALILEATGFFVACAFLGAAAFLVVTFFYECL